jgi:hypothetical protein
MDTCRSLASASADAAFLNFEYVRESFGEVFMHRP